jgi:hypothetical protein
VFLVAAGTNVVVVLLALFVLRPLRAGQLRRMIVAPSERGS